MRKPIDDLAGFGTASEPASTPQGVVAFAPRTTPLLELAKGLSGLSHDLDATFDARLKQQASEDSEAGRIAALSDNFKSWRELVASGKAPLSDSPAFYTAYEQQKGRVAGQAYTAFLNDKYTGWEGAGSDDMSGKQLIDVMPDFRHEYLEQLGERSAEFMTGWSAYASQAEDNLMSQHIAASRKVAEENMGTQVYNEFYNLLSAGLPQAQLFARIDQVYSRQDFIGIRNRIGPLLLQAVIDRATETGDPAIIDVMEKYSRTDAASGQRVDVLKHTKAQAALAKARVDAFKQAVGLDGLRRTQEDDHRRRVTRESVGQAIVQMAQDGKPRDPLKFAAEVARSGGDAGDAMGAAATVNSIHRNTEHTGQADRIQDLFYEVMTAVEPSKNYADYLRELDAIGATPAEARDFHEMWEKYAERGASILSEYPGLQSVLAWANKPVMVLGKERAQSPEEKLVNQRWLVQAARSVLRSPKGTTKGEIEREIEEEFRKLRKENAARTAAAATPPQPPAATTPTAATSAQQLPPVATSAEIAALQGKPRDVINGLLASKALLPPDQLALARQQIIAGTRGPESERLRRIMEKAGINTADMRRAWIELIQRGQSKFVPRPR